MPRPPPFAAAALVAATLLVTLATEANARTIAKQGEKCGTIIGIECAAGLWCDLMPRACGGADLPGKCVPSPAVCTGLYKPVCGCDSKTHSNNCVRQNAKVLLDHEGACKERGKK